MKVKKEAYLLSFFNLMIDLSDKSSLCLEIKKKMENKKLNEVILPIPDNSPPEIPRIILDDQDDRGLKVEIFPNRINFKFTKEYGELNDILSKIVNLLNSLSLKIIRIGLVHSFFYSELNQSASSLIEKNYLQKEIQGNYSQIHLQYFKEEQIEKLKTNFWTRHFIDPTNNKDSDYVLEFDVNTNIDIKEIKTENLQSFYKSADDIIANKKSLYEQHISNT